MANQLYPSGRSYLDAGGNPASDTIKCVGVDLGAYTFSAAHDNLDDVPSGARIGTPATLSGKSWSQTTGVFDASDVTITNSSSTTIEAVAVWKDTGVESTSTLIALIDTATGLPLSPAAANYTITWNASGLFTYVPILFVGAETAQTSTVATLNVPIPAGTAVGDVMFAIMACTTTGSSHSMPSGWGGVLHTEFNTVTEVEMYWKVAASGDTPGTNVPFTSSGTVNQRAAVIVFRGIDAPDAGVTASPTTSSTTHTTDASAVSPVGRALAIILAGWETANVTHDPPTGWSEALDTFGNSLGIVVHYDTVDAGSLGSISWDSSGSATVPRSIDTADHTVAESVPSPTIAGSSDTIITASTATATADGGTTAIVSGTVITATSASATADGSDTTIVAGSATTVTASSGEATATGGDTTISAGATITASTATATADGGDTTIVATGDVIITCSGAIALASGDEVVVVYNRIIVASSGTATASGGSGIPTLVGPPVSGGDGAGFGGETLPSIGLLRGRRARPGYFRIKLTSLHRPYGPLDGTAAVPAYTLARIEQYVDAAVEIPANDSRTARVTISMHDEACEHVKLLETLLHVVYVTPNAAHLVFWGALNGVQWNSESETVTLSAMDRSLSLKHAQIRFGDRILNEATHPTLPNYRGRGYVALDSEGVRWLRDCGFNTDGQVDAGVPDLGIADGTDLSSGPLDFLTFDKIEVQRGDEVWATILDVVGHSVAPDFELEPIDDVPGYYARLNFWDRQGNVDPDELVLHDGFGNDNCRINYEPSADVITHAHVLSAGGQKRVTVTDVVSRLLIGVYSRFIPTNYASNKTEPLTKRGQQIVDAKGRPQDYFSVIVNRDADLHYRDDFGIGDEMRAVIRRGRLVRDMTGHITKVVLQQFDTAGNVAPEIEVGVAGGDGTEGDL